MGNTGSSGLHGRRRNSTGGGHPTPPPSQASQPEITAHRHVFEDVTPYPSQYPNPSANASPYYYYPGYYPHPATTPIPLAAPYNYHHPSAHGNWVNGRYPCGPMTQPVAYVEHQKAVTIRNDVNVKKETLRIEPDEENPGKYLVEFTFDATVGGSITIIFFAKDGEDCSLIPMKESLYPPITLHFQQGLAQKFKQRSGTGIDLSTFQDGGLSKDGNSDMYPLAVKAEASVQSGNEVSGSTNSQITHAVFEKDKEEYQVKVVKQILWVKGMRYVLQEIYGIGNSAEDELDGNDPGKECVICLSAQRDTTVLPCRHMCMCSECAKVLRFQTTRCPICRQPVERLLEINVTKGTDE